MEGLLDLRHAILTSYKMVEGVANIILKFILGFFVTFIASELSMGGITGIKVIFISLICAVLTSFLSSGAIMIIASIICSIYISFASIEVAIFAAIIFFLILVFYVRLLPQQSLIIILTLVGFYFNIPYIGILFSGIYLGITGIVPSTISAFLWWAGTHIKELAEISPRADFKPMGMPDAFIKLYIEIYEIISNDKSWVILAVIFGIVVIITYIITLIPMDYAREVALILGTVILILSLIVCNIMNCVSIGILSILLGNIISVFVVGIIMFMDVVLDYESTERVKFEDEKNVYYVKVIPKRTINKDI